MPLLDLSKWDPVPCRCRSQLNLKPQSVPVERTVERLSDLQLRGTNSLAKKYDLGVPQGWILVEDMNLNPPFLHILLRLLRLLRSPSILSTEFGVISDIIWHPFTPSHSCRWQLCKVIRLHLCSHGFCFRWELTRGKAMIESYTIE